MKLQPVGPKSRRARPAADLPPGGGGLVAYPTFQEYHARRPALRALLTRVLAAGTVGGLALLAGCSDEGPVIGGTPLPGARTPPPAPPVFQGIDRAPSPPPPVSFARAVPRDRPATGAAPLSD